MRTRAGAVPLALVIAWGAGCAGEAPSTATGPTQESTFRAGLHHPGVFEGPAPRNLARERWVFQTGGTVRGTPAVAGDRVYVGSGDGRLYALDRSTGAELWRVEAGSAVQSIPAVAGGRVFFATRDGTAFAVDATDGSPLWTVETGALIPFPWGGEGWDYWVGSVTVAQGRAIFGAGDGVVRAVDVETGGPIWQFATEGRIRATPAVHEGRVLIGSFDGTLYALDLTDGSVHWTFATDGASMDSSEWGFDRRSIQSSAAVVDGVVYVGARDANLYALDFATGEVLWKTNDDTSWVISSPAVAGGVVYSATSSSAIAYAVDAAGEELWRRQMGGPVFGSPALVGDVLVVTDHGGWVSALDAADGTLLWRYRARDDVKSSPVVVDGLVYFGSDDGGVYALESGPDPTPVRAVFFDEALTDFSTLTGAESISRYFRVRGYEVLDAAALAGFMQDRIADGTRSVVVFTQDWLPAAVAEAAGPESTFRRYLEAGGKVVWLGYPPMTIGRDPETGQFTDFDLERSSSLLGVPLDPAGDDYGVRVTEEGERWGLPTWWTAFGGIDPAGVTRVLASDENGLASAWAREYGGPPGTGFVHLQGTLALWDLDAVARAAEHGILRASP